MTIHKAKGLQFDTVIVPGLDRLPGGRERRLLRWLQLLIDREPRLVVAPLAVRGEQPNRLYAWLQHLEREKLLHERRRLLYVATTRARRSLHLFGIAEVVDRPDGGREVASPKADSMLGMLWPFVADEYRRRLEDFAPHAEQALQPRNDPPLARLPIAWPSPGAPDGPRIAVREPPGMPAAIAVSFDWVSETARHVGTVVHRELQRLAAGGDRPRLESPSWQRRIEDELGELGVPAEHRVAATTRVGDAIRATLGDERGRWLLDASHRDAATELKLSGFVAGELVHVAIDRSFVSADGVRWIVDYKTSPHEGGGLDEFLDRERERYRGQLARYAELARHLGPEPVRLGLYFPLQRGWREWDPA
jgi:ATP-dependent helicase/nuclease subunit A